MSDVPRHLRCIDCGRGRAIGGGLHTAAECRDNLRTRLASPSVLDAYEAVLRLGVARAQREAVSFPIGMGDGGMSARQDAGQAMRRALGAIDALADRLAAEGTDQ